VSSVDALEVCSNRIAKRELSCVDHVHRRRGDEYLTSIGCGRDSGGFVDG